MLHSLEKFSKLFKKRIIWCFNKLGSKFTQMMDLFTDDARHKQSYCKEKAEVHLIVISVLWQVAQAVTETPYLAHQGPIFWAILQNSAEVHWTLALLPNAESRSREHSHGVELGIARNSWSNRNHWWWYISPWEAPRTHFCCKPL